MNTRAHIIVSGRVQGVFFRASAREEARKSGVRGWVKNLSSGEVEMVAEGERNRVEALISWANQGPSGAKVSRVKVKWEDFKGEFEEFKLEW